MALTFVKASSQKLTKASAVVSGVPLTIAGWFQYTGTSGGWPILVALTDATGATYFSVQIDYANTWFLLETQGASTEDLKCQTAIPINTWFHGCGVWTTAASRAVYTNGANKTTSAVSLSVNTPTQTLIGWLLAASTSYYSDCQIAFPAIWNVALTDTEVASLAAGASPLQVRPSALVSYTPLIGAATEPDLISATGYARTGTPAFFANPRIYRP